MNYNSEEIIDLDIEIIELYGEYSGFETIYEDWFVNGENKELKSDRIPIVTACLEYKTILLEENLDVKTREETEQKLKILETKISSEAFEYIDEVLSTFYSEPIFLESQIGQTSDYLGQVVVSFIVLLKICLIIYFVHFY
ncbi:hypothetical protein [Aureivirga sp. CE67]|uniref:hypothetical protein n=1 Tax=Aureivirga sp. CE67 TaxID=1788983 RepID=UPI0018CA21E1|nr:hypothetical protein [Aureivirga sp. CE67]